VKRFLYAAHRPATASGQLPTSEDAPIRPMYPYALTKNWESNWSCIGRKSSAARSVAAHVQCLGPRAAHQRTYGAVFAYSSRNCLPASPDDRRRRQQTRDFTYVTDVVDAFATAAASNEPQDLQRWKRRHLQLNRLVELPGREGCRAHPEAARRAGLHVCRCQQDQRDLGWNSRSSSEDGVKMMLGHIDH